MIGGARVDSAPIPRPEMQHLWLLDNALLPRRLYRKIFRIIKECEQCAQVIDIVLPLFVGGMLPSVPLLPQLHFVIHVGEDILQALQRPVCGAFGDGRIVFAQERYQGERMLGRSLQVQLLQLGFRGSPAYTEQVVKLGKTMPVMAPRGLDGVQAQEALEPEFQSDRKIEMATVLRDSQTVCDGQPDAPPTGERSPSLT